MRYSILLAILLLITPSFAQKDDKSKDKPIAAIRLKKAGSLGDRYDRFTDRRIVMLADLVQMPGMSMMMGNGVSITVYGTAVSEGRELKSDFKPGFTVLIASGQRVPPFEAAPIFILYDGQRLALEHTERERKLEERPVLKEMPNLMAVTSAIDWEVYKKIASSKDVEIKVDRFVFKLKPESLENMRSFVEYVEKAKQK